jgi:transcriptional regulator with XRE-family HTH domain
MNTKEAFIIVLNDLLQKDGRAISVIASELGVKPQLLSSYKTGSRYPKENFFIKWKELYGQDIRVMVNDAMTNSPSEDNITLRLVDELKASYHNSIEELKTLMHDTIQLQSNQINQLKETVADLRDDKKELLKRIPTVKPNK